MTDREAVTGQPETAGYGGIPFERIDADVMVERKLDEAVAFQLAIGPAGEVHREAGAKAMCAQAEAADMAARPYVKAPPPAIASVYDWSGFYIGGTICCTWRSDFGLSGLSREQGQTKPLAPS